MRATNAVMREHDPSSHAETRTVRLACKKLKRPSLAGHTMYSTCEPCAMCMANALWAGLDRVVYGATIDDANRFCRQIHIPAKEVVERSDISCVVQGPVLRELCNTLFTHPNMQKAFRSWSIRAKKNRKARVDRCGLVLSFDNYGSEACRRARFGILGDESRVLTQPQVVEQLSRDFYWYSPVLRKQLDGKVGDLVVQPLCSAEIQDVLRYCHAHDLPVTVRGAGTGNYGQAVPLHGGVVLDLARMDRIESISADGVAVCQPGVRLGALENEARKSGWELRCYPSTIVKASLGGFLGGGSGGIGSVAHGNLRDFQTVRAIEVVTMEAEPRLQFHEGEAVHEILHAWGTNGVITRIWLALAPAVDWSQCVVAFDTFDAAFDFSERSPPADCLDRKRWSLPVRVADSFIFHAGETVHAGGQGADLFHDCHGAVRRARSCGSRGRRGSGLLRAIPGVAYASAAFRLHLEPHHPLGHESG